MSWTRVSSGSRSGAKASCLLPGQAPPQPRARASLCGGQGAGWGTHSVCPRQKDSMLCGAAAQLTRIFSSRSAVRTKQSSGLTACARGEKGQTRWSARWLPPHFPRPQLRGPPRASAVSGCLALPTPVFPSGHFSLLHVSPYSATHIPISTRSDPPLPYRAPHQPSCHPAAAQASWASQCLGPRHLLFPNPSSSTRPPSRPLTRLPSFTPLHLPKPRPRSPYPQVGRAASATAEPTPARSSP